MSDMFNANPFVDCSQQPHLIFAKQDDYDTLNHDNSISIITFACLFADDE